ncbi:ABC transporter permease [Rhodanobacter glycinis]|uniref:Putative ABC transport system permease protein n=1 Tax=Rhodanobacter glycinis TaxID=582702 RepID=A0A1I4A878_9GAMM|nr:FtsX-like permease family protein [Rhodanobacter glycinis]SFK52622.1 putative ABC transport system permease protein [Rhodanobacter glycinis]
MRTFRQIQPILAALRSHKTAVILLVLEIALTMAVLGNLVFIVYGTIQRSHVSTGVAESQIGLIQSITVIGEQSQGTTAGDLAALRNVPGVTHAAYGGPPLWYVERDPVFLDPSRQHPVAQMYEFQGSQDLSRTLGLHIVEGHDFSDDELPVLAKMSMSKDFQFPVLITRALADRLYPGGNALGRVLYDGNAASRVVGIVDHLRGEITGRPDDDYSMVYEYVVGAQNMGGGFMIRASDPARLPQVLHAAAAALQKADPAHVQNKLFTMPELRAKYFRSDLATGRMLLAIILILLVVTALGVSGLASFWVQQRRRQIGMRRALGATRGDILRYFQIENFLIVTGGVLLGALFAYALNLFLMHRFELAHLPANYLLAGAVALWLLGQLAVLGPALRAAAVPPVVATRSV